MMTIGTKKIGDTHPTYIIAEIGINYNGKFDLALKMIEVAKAAKVDAVKVQIIDADKSYARSSASYDIFKKVQMSLDDWRKIAVYAREIGMDMFATFTHPDDIAIAEEFQFPAIKISSSNLTNFLLLKAASRAGKPLIVSTGLSYLSEVDEAVRYLEAQGQKDIAILLPLKRYICAR
ncbi:MAG: N-acetylneuraminate synthase [Parcubacteria group bacterium GW2011_GWC2_45_7]|nr:MAG: N-acetylneuraminate synthase [Parcubacteria group bacterium GW2011_GWC2_45_7]